MNILKRVSLLQRVAVWGYFWGYPEAVRGQIPPVLTERAARTAKPQEKPYKLRDGGGLYVVVQPGGRKLWRLKYRFAGKEKLLSFGAYPAVTLARLRV